MMNRLVLRLATQPLPALHQFKKTYYKLETSTGTPGPIVEEIEIFFR